jgi:hypothetical protein
MAVDKNAFVWEDPFLIEDQLSEDERMVRDGVAVFAADKLAPWKAFDHWNTEHPHIHMLVRGVADNGENLVISRDYIRQGMHNRASDIAR